MLSLVRRPRHFMTRPPPCRVRGQDSRFPWRLTAPAFRDTPLPLRGLGLAVQLVACEPGWRAVAVAPDQPVRLAGFAERDQRPAELLDGLEGPEPEQDLLQHPERAMSAPPVRAPRRRRSARPLPSGARMTPGAGEGPARRRSECGPEGRALQAQIEAWRGKVFVFLADRRVPATNTISWRAIRPSVVFRKVTNGFRSGWGAGVHAGYRSLTRTARLHAHTATDAVHGLVSRRQLPVWTSSCQPGARSRCNGSEAPVC